MFENFVVDAVLFFLSFFGGNGIIFFSGNMAVLASSTTLRAELKKLTVLEATKRFGWNENKLQVMVSFVRLIRPELRSVIDIEWKRDGRKKETREEEEESYSAYCVSRKKEFHLHASQMTLGDVLRALDYVFTLENYPDTYYRCDFFPSARRDLGTLLAKIGFTKVDCSIISPRTVSFELLKSLSRSELLSLDAHVLGTISKTELDNFSPKMYWNERGERILEEDLRKIRDQVKRYTWERRVTVREVLSLKPEQLTGKGAAKTIELLERLGLGMKDGLLMQKETDPREKLIAELVSKEGLSREIAVHFMNIAARRNWI